MVVKKFSLLFLFLLLNTIQSIAQFQWKHIGPTDTSNVTNITIAPSNANIIYLSVFKDALWRSDDKAFSWNKLQVFDGCQGIVSLAVHPTSSHSVYATSGG